MQGNKQRKNTGLRSSLSSFPLVWSLLCRIEGIAKISIKDCLFFFVPLPWTTNKTTLCSSGIDISLVYILKLFPTEGKNNSAQASCDKIDVMTRQYDRTKPYKEKLSNFVL